MNLSIKTLPAALTLAALAVTAQSAMAQHQKGCCGPVCVLECYDKEVEVVCWKCECEDFCLPGHCCLGCKNSCDPCCGKGNGGAAKGGACQKGGCGLFGRCCGKLFCWKDESPAGCPTHHHRKVLYRKIEIVKVPAYRWVIQSCKGGDKVPAGAVLPAEGDIPAPPPVDAAQLRYRIQDQAGDITHAHGMTAQLANVIAR
jgi:hypothetical protein